MSETNEWKPIKTAPRGRHIEVGGWYNLGTSIIWRTDVAIRRMFWWGGHIGDYHSHWRELPPPKQEKAGQ